MQETIRFQPIGECAIARWNKPQRFDFLHRLPTAPIADTELLHLSHYCPTVIRVADDGPRVLILLDPAMVLSTPVDKDGRWRPPYAPIALRSLPFWPGEKPAEILVSPELVAQTADESFALLDTSDNPSEQFAAVITWIERLQHGMRQLSEASKLIMAADLLVPLVVHQPGLPLPVETDYFTVSPQKVNALSAARAAAFTSARCLPLDLVTACLFSRRLLARRVTLQKVDAAAPSVPGESAKEIDFVSPLDIKLDTSPLFSFEHFVGAESTA